MWFLQKGKKIFITIFILLTNLSFATAAPMTEEQSLKKFTEKLETEMEKTLQKKLKRQKTAFSLNFKKNNESVIFSVPDYIERETVFSLKMIFENEKLKLSGKVFTAEEKALISKIATETFTEKKISNELTFFPYDQERNYGVINKSLVNAYIDPAETSLATQLLLGTPIKILDYSPDKKKIRVYSMDDQYLSWINFSDITPLTTTNWEKWVKERNMIITEEVKGSEQIFAGTILPSEKEQSVKLPSGKVLKIEKNKLNYFSQKKNPDSEISKKAKEFLALGEAGKTIYLWGGTAGKTLDCSGFNQLVYRLAGIFLPRDADQQQNFSTPLAKTLAEIEQLKPGDLVFFSENRIYATHTGIYAGNYQLIHSSKGGNYSGIKMNTLKGGGEYDLYLQKIYFGGGRINH